ncbi:E3 ubiquitin-protein ligase [Sodiomyces alkalinus F11]|uniref:E3 ubiquitin-protein ligase n=1 Tax=Sodiomyces alkalinus (strain CBS 110278 / VKM F-3762 / F11) TaxID=1314773 RepID=A0A3N2Q8F8_SODAK|nr:E3 ubiquitin-protein ligase [Sodiomyces alkalinus F11]ROT42938.1 E3 ubiquitin-protein ligase [Sodiomyces alkalinus F11]
MSEAKALQLKAEGNRCFQQGDYVGAEGFYSKAIIANPKNAIFYTNRANARLKLQLWDAAISDCHEALALAEKNMKAEFYLSQALLPLGDYDGAVQAAMRAHRLCVESGERERASLSAITALVLRCKKERWDHKEKTRKREGQYFEEEMVGLLSREKAKAVEGAEGEGEKRELASEWDAKISELRNVFEKSRAKDEQRREVPDWAIDDISFGIMVDPVITKTGKSYERASIMEHLHRHPSDPLTREPLVPSELRPNLALKQACEEFLDENGWAVDW